MFSVSKGVTKSGVKIWKRVQRELIVNSCDSMKEYCSRLERDCTTIFVLDTSTSNFVFNVFPIEQLKVILRTPDYKRYKFIPQFSLEEAIILFSRYQLLDYMKESNITLKFFYYQQVNEIERDISKEEIQNDDFCRVVHCGEVIDFCENSDSVVDSLLESLLYIHQVLKRNYTS